ncbi:MAG: nuclear transport factor 2 family protein [Anaerolineales bacterium]|jgi:steroid delta-isomerase-like uncharacterized protein
MTVNAKHVMNDIATGISSHDAEKIASCFTKDCVYEDMALGEVMHGREAVKAGYSDLFAAFPDFKVETLSLFKAGNWVGSEWVMTGTSTAGKSFSTRGASISEFEEGKIKRNTDYYDPSAFLQATR